MLPGGCGFHPLDSVLGDDEREDGSLFVFQMYFQMETIGEQSLEHFRHLFFGGSRRCQFGQNVEAF